MQGCGGGGLECAQHQTAQVACACFRRRMLRLFCFCLTLVVSRAMHTRDASSITDIDVPGAPGGESSSSASERNCGSFSAWTLNANNRFRLA
eukprot:s755_g31.t3